jgi:phenylpropionate dioxygenase-like ring-hydroxylating dioxygenase large terminal subunit
MMSAEQNETMTRVGPGRPAGRLLRQYWQPVALVEELDGPRPAKAVRLLGQDFVLFRDEQRRLGLLDRDCPHRGADLAYGRLEDGGLRCPFHGWLFDVEGRCLETPAEPVGSRLCEGIRQGAYPVIERSGIVFAYVGVRAADGQPPALPHFDCFVAPKDYTFAFKGLWDCNWLQALEVGIDPAHASFLHRFFEDEDPAQAYGRQFRAASGDTDIPMTRVLREYARPAIEVEPTDYGLRLTALRRLGDARTHVRVTNQVFPQAFVIPLSADMTITQWHVPVDDTRSYWYAIFTSFGAPVDRAKMREQRLQLYQLPDYVPRLNRANQWGFDPLEQRARTYTGMGEDINVHDQWAVESQGPIQDRTREHLGSTDKAIVAFRRMLMRAIDAVARGESPPMFLDAEAAARMLGPATVDGVADSESPEALRAYWREADARKRAGAPWSAPKRAA